jgi:hypothetical protein
MLGQMFHIPFVPAELGHAGYYTHIILRGPRRFLNPVSSAAPSSYDRGG